MNVLFFSWRTNTNTQEILFIFAYQCNPWRLELPFCSNMSQVKERTSKNPFSGRNRVAKHPTLCISELKYQKEKHSSRWNLCCQPKGNSSFCLFWQECPETKAKKWTKGFLNSTISIHKWKTTPFFFLHYCATKPVVCPKERIEIKFCWNFDDNSQRSQQPLEKSGDFSILFSSFTAFQMRPNCPKLQHWFP